VETYDDDVPPRRPGRMHGGAAMSDAQALMFMIMVVIAARLLGD
jgi:hypothetical protein